MYRLDPYIYHFTTSLVNPDYCSLTGNFKFLSSGIEASMSTFLGLSVYQSVEKMSKFYKSRYCEILYFCKYRGLQLKWEWRGRRRRKKRKRRRSRRGRR